MCLERQLLQLQTLKSLNGFNVFSTLQIEKVLNIRYQRDLVGLCSIESIYNGLWMVNLQISLTINRATNNRLGAHSNAYLIKLHMFKQNRNKSKKYKQKRKIKKKLYTQSTHSYAHVRMHVYVCV